MTVVDKKIYIIHQLCSFMDKQTLADLGLSEREIAVYLALLRLSTTTTGPLVKSSGVQNAKIYETLEKLMSKGLATYIFKGKIKHFQATNPSILLNFLEEKKASLQNTVKELKALREQKEPTHESKIYEGIKAIKAAFYEMYDYIGKNSEYYVFPIGDQLESEELTLFWAEVLHKQQQMKIKIRTLPHKKWKNIFEKHYKQYKLVNIRYTNQEFPTGIFIFKDHLLNIVWGEKPVGFLIKSGENSSKWQKFFDEQWKIAKT